MNCVWAAPLLVTLHSICGIIFRYVPFRSLVSRDRQKKLFLSYAVVNVVEFSVLCLNVLSISHVPHLFYIININAWFTIYFIINCIFIRGRFFQHLFVLGMQIQFTYFVHTLAILTIVSLSSAGVMPPFDKADWDSMEGMLYFLYFIIFSYSVWYSQRKLIPVFLSSINGIRWDMLGVIPLMICYATMISTLQSSHLAISPKVFFVRFTASASVFILWRYVVCSMRRYNEMIELERENFVLKARSESIAEQARMIKSHEEKLRFIRHDLRHNVRIMASLLRDGRTDNALEMLKGLDKETAAPERVFFCENEFVNSALIVYITKAHENGVPVECAADIPRGLNINSSELSILVANLLENALNASLKQPPERRGIKISARCDSGCFVFNISNIFDGSVKFGPDGLPVSCDVGHGTGLRSAVNIAAKSGGTLLCTFEDNIFVMRAIFPLPHRK